MSYQILGRAVKSEYIALGTILTAVGATYGATSGKKSTPKPEASVPKFGAQSSEEENFIQNFIKEAEKAEGSGKH